MRNKISNQKPTTENFDKNQLTIVLTLKDRSEFTFRWMNYMNSIKCPYKILIADGGKDLRVEKKLIDHSRYINLDYEYIRYPYDKSFDEYYNKCVDAFSRVKSKYVLMADNDDFYILDTIPKMLHFLNKNLEYVGCRGQTINLSLQNSKRIKINNTIGHSYSAEVNTSDSIEQNNWIERVERYLDSVNKNDYYNNWYCIFRTLPLQNIWKKIASHKINESVINELFFHYVILLQGKIKILSDSFYIRQNGTSEMTDTLNKEHNIPERFLLNNSFSEFHHAIQKEFDFKTKSEKERFFIGVSNWFQKICFYLTVEKRQQKNWTFPIRMLFRRFKWIRGIYIRLLSHIFNERMKRKPVRLPYIEKFIINK